MCDVCNVFRPEYREFDCPMVTEWPDSPFTPDEQAIEERSWERFKRERPDAAKEIEQSQTDCDHESHHHMQQDWQGVTIIVKVCDGCGATVSLFEDL